MSEQFPEATERWSCCPLPSPERTLNQTESFLTSWELCFLWGSLTGPEERNLQIYHSRGGSSQRLDSCLAFVS